MRAFVKTKSIFIFDHQVTQFFFRPKCFTGAFQSGQIRMRELWSLFQQIFLDPVLQLCSVSKLEIKACKSIIFREKGCLHCHNPWIQDGRQTQSKYAQGKWGHSKFVLSLVYVVCVYFASCS